ncbi:MAG: multidrug efflux RND transporter permease subunit [Bacteroidales bacterium]|jgi:HAE1 family hydrophobic/amphiphilic exporter-1|nr:multidrug efflux RND transporter permease subunit [Bacteroidales bacterium]
MGEFFVRRPIVAMVLSIIIVIVGLLALRSVPVSQYPDITPPTIKISTNFTGANAINVEQGVAAVMEQKINGVEEMIYLKSTNASDGNLSMDVSFKVGTDLDNANMLTQNRVSQAMPFMPASVKQMGITTKKSLTFPLLLVSLVSENPAYDDRFLSNYATINLVDALSRINGVGEVKIFGSADYAMRIWLKPDIMSKLDIVVEDVTKALQEQNQILPGGKFGAQPAPAGTEFTYGVVLQDRLIQEGQFADIIIKTKEDGSKVLLGDIAEITLGTENYNMSSRMNGNPAASIAIFQTPGTNALDVAEKIKSLMAEMSQRFPDDIDYKISLDTTLAVSEGITEIVHTLFEAIILVILVVFIFLQNWRATLIPLITVPVSLIGTFMVFPLLGFSVNVLSLLGLVLAIGIVVDDAIVVVEAVMHHIEHGKSPREATIQAMKEVSGPVVAIALILCAVFIPVAMVPGITGRLYQQFAITIAVSVAFSAFSALSLSPALASMLLKPSKPMNERKGILAKFFNGFNRIFDRVTGGYVGLAGYLSRKVVRVVMILVVVIGAAALLGKSLPGGFVPDEDQGYFIMNVVLPPASSVQRTDEVCRQAEAIMKKYESLEYVTPIVGYSFLTGASQSNVASFFVMAKEWSHREGTVIEIMNELNAEFAREITSGNVVAFGPPPIPGLGVGAGFSMFIQDRAGNTPEFLQEQTNKFVAAARQRPEIGRINSTFNASSPQIQLEVDRLKAMKLGVPVASVNQAIGTYLGGTYVNDFNRFGRQYKVFVQADAAYRSKPEDLSMAYVRNSKGEMVPLTTLVTASKISAPEFTNRFNLYRSAELSGIPAPGYSSSQALKALEETAAQVLPQSMGYAWSNMSFQEKEAEGSAGVIFLMALLFVFLILAAQYESWKLPFSVLLGTPFSVLGAFLGLFLARLTDDGYLNNVFAQIGLVLLIGLVAKNAILIVEFAKAEYEKGVDLFEAAMVAARLRFRPILMTAFAFILGVTPLLTAAGAGAEGRKVMGMAVFSGMLVATILGVLIVPALFVFIERAGKKKTAKPVEIKKEGE